MSRLAVILLCVTLGILPAASCHKSPASGSQPPQEHLTQHSSNLLMDAESPAIPLTARAGPLDAGEQGEALALTRNSDLPYQGLWAVQVAVHGAAHLSLSTPARIHDFDTLAIHCRSAEPGVANQVRARAYVADDQGHVYAGDWVPVFLEWQSCLVDLHAAADAGVDLVAMAKVGLEVSAAPDAGEVVLLTDAWELTSAYHAYIGQRLGVSRSFYVQRDGMRLSVGQVGKFEIAFSQRTTDSAADARPWMEVREGGKLVMGQSGTGLMLLDQDQIDRLGDRTMREDGMKDPTAKATPDPPALAAWPGAISTYEWALDWCSPIAAVVEVKQTSGPFDRLGRPAVEAKWRFMIYETGQVFASLSWDKDTKASEPVAIALCLDRAVIQDADLPKAFLRDLYPAGWNQKILPHEMQTGAPVAMFAKTLAPRQSWWGASTEHQRIFAVTLDRHSPVACMMLLNAPTAVDQVAAFSTYLSPAAATMKVGTLDTTFPGDFDNDSLVESYGFQTIRMTGGRAWFTLEPGNRPIFYPALLLTIPAAERERTDLSKFNLLINVDGHQLANPPRWTDGSFLVQLPYILSKPVSIEATLTPK